MNSIKNIFMGAAKMAITPFGYVIGSVCSFIDCLNTGLAFSKETPSDFWFDVTDASEDMWHEGKEQFKRGFGSPKP